MFDYALKHGIMDYDDAQNEMNFEKTKKLVDKVHPFGITQDPDGRYSTYVRDETKKDGRRGVKKTYEKDLYEFLFHFYGLEDDDNSKKPSL